MPQTLSAKKALRQTKRRTAFNLKIKKAYKKAVKKAREKKDKNSLSEAFSVLDQAAKKGVIHQRKASRLKSRLSQLVTKTKKTKTKSQTKKKTKNKKPKKRKK